MLISFQRIGTSRVLPAFAAAGAAVVVGSIAVTILAIVGVIGCSTRALRAFGLIAAEPPVPSERDTIEGVVVHRSSAGMLDR